MREVAFINQNKTKWLEIEQAIYGKTKLSPDDMANLYIQLMNDLSFAQTYYKKSNTTKYLNQLAVTIYQKIYKTKRTDQNRILYFFKTELPLILHKNRKTIWFSFILFFIFCGIGVLSSHYDDSFVRLILSDEYVDETMENIRNGDPVAIYQGGSNWGSFLGITINNMRVAALCFITGALAGLFTMYIYMQNAIMIGAFQYMFYREGVLWESVQGIWIHGAMEIFSIVIAAAAGFGIAKAIFFPQTFSRLLSFINGFKENLKIYLSTLPFFFFAGLLEGFVTRYAKAMGPAGCYAIIISTFLIISFYYLIYPHIVYRQQKNAINE
jgi:uncharacterized membrane protein SpoIIM required for sporulation